eukprot:5986143-Heterocapsa_arctica.AAC.1
MGAREDLRDTVANELAAGPTAAAPDCNGSMPTEGTAAVALAALPAPPLCSRDFRSASFRWRSRCRSLPWGTGDGASVAM